MCLINSIYSSIPTMGYIVDAEVLDYTSFNFACPSSDVHIIIIVMALARGINKISSFLDRLYKNQCQWSLMLYMHVEAAN